MVDPTKAMRSARRLAQILTVGSAILAIGAIVSFLLGLQDLGETGAALAAKAGFEGAPIVLGQTLLLMLIAAIHVGVWIALLMVARHLFLQISDGNPKGASVNARRVAYLLWGMFVWGLLSQAFVSVTATWGYPEGERTLSIAFGSAQISIAFAAVVASFLAHAFVLGAELWEDHQEVI